MLSSTLFHVQSCLAHRDANIIHTEKTGCEYRDLTQRPRRNQSVDAMLDPARSGVMQRTQLCTLSHLAHMLMHGRHGNVCDVPL